MKRILTIGLMLSSLNAIEFEVKNNPTPETFTQKKGDPKSYRAVPNGAVLQGVSRDDPKESYGIYCPDDKLIVARKILLTVSPPCIDFYNMGSSKIVAPNKIETITDPLPLDGISLQNTPNLPKNMHLGFKGCENTYGNIYTQLELQRLVKGKWEIYCRGSMNTINTMKKGK